MSSPLQSHRFTRRQLLWSTATGLASLPILPLWANRESKYQVTTFTVDITPPLGHPLCGGWLRPAEVIEDRLQGLGVVIVGGEKPVVLMALDWCELCNEANLLWRKTLAEVVGTDSEHVAVQCVHPHNAPLADTSAEKVLQEKFKVQQSLDLEYFDSLLKKVGAAAQEALGKLQPVTHVGIGKGEVKQVGSNRRIIGSDGKIRAWRGSATKNKEDQAEPEGLIDPWLRTISFWNGDQPLVALSYYATHPMSYYGDGRVTPDFAGLARMNRQAEMPGVFQVYFNGCAGNIAPGKYNDGSHENRPVLRDRIHEGLRMAWENTVKTPLTHCEWKRVPVTMELRREPEFVAENLRKLLDQATLKNGQIDGATGHVAIKLAWLARQEQPIDLTCLDLGIAQILHLPGEPFVEYQLYAQSLKPEGFVCVAGYGDGGPGYIPIASAYPEGGYEPSVANAGPGSEAILKTAIGDLLK